MYGKLVEEVVRGNRLRWLERVLRKYPNGRCGIHGLCDRWKSLAQRPRKTLKDSRKKDMKIRGLKRGDAIGRDRW